MKPLVVAALALASMAGSARGQQHNHDPLAGHTPPPGTIVVTINPEARVAAAWSDATRPNACEPRLDILVHIHNEGFVTSNLSATLVGADASTTTLSFSGDVLRGVPMETRMLSLSRTELAPSDVTIEFALANDPTALTEARRVNLHLLCRQS
ncbi:hypothetical protein [Terricaulis silvestris]|uniref:Uncharacterized protein n=1 Tax=Terricaulis silvestris TaxID=2686094 RepID=A0A6I6MNK3_9CAUL|nr:hypothetical protein [Terricaulis silvestris]QGZ94906.1 hypothetical protein DSM104635_01741 [Terricaulis silvestris]